MTKAKQKPRSITPTKKFNKFHILTLVLVFATIGSLASYFTFAAWMPPDSGIIVEPVAVQYCAPGTVCTNLEFQFPYHYTLFALRNNRIVASADAMGPRNYKLTLYPGTYTLKMTTNYKYVPQPPVSSIIVTPHQFNGPVKIHFMMANSTTYSRPGL